jgi:hypothetical protein
MKKKRLLCLTFALGLMFCISAPAFALVAKTSDFYVADYANVLKSTTKSDIISTNNLLQS